MKKITLIAAIAMVAFTTNSFAQDATALVGTSSSVIKPIAVTGVTALSFGDIVGTTVGGTVSVSPAGVRTSSVGDLLIATTGTVSAASFTVTGEAGYTYAITLPLETEGKGFDVSNSDTTPATMGVGAFSSNPNSTGTLTDGTETVNVGATLTVGANQAVGEYTNANGMAITVQYN